MAHGKLSVTDSTDMKTILSAPKLIPIYQRQFVWDEDNRTEFLNDLVDACNRGESAPEYFIGSMVFRKNENGEYEVVDGQQRITTILIVVSAAISLGHELAGDDREKQRVWNKISDLLHSDDPDVDFLGTPHRPNLKHADSIISDAYAKLATGERIDTDITKHNMLKCLQEAQDEATEFLRRYVHDKPQQKQGHALAVFLKYLLNKVVCIHHVASEMDTALTIFGRLNTAGKNLTRLEIVRGMSFQNAEENGAWTEIEEQWKDLEKILHNDIAPGGKGKRRKLIDHDQLLSYKLFLDLPQITKTFSGKDDPWIGKEKLAKLLLDPCMREVLSNPTQFVAELKEFSTEILALRTADKDRISSKEVRPLLQDIAHIAPAQTQWLMVAIPLLRHFPTDVAAFRALRNMVFIFSHVQTGSGSSSGVYKKLSSKLSEAHLNRPPTQADLNHVTELMRDQVKDLFSEYEAQIKSRRYTDTADRKKIRWALEFIEVELTNLYGVEGYSSMIDFAYRRINVDHLQPSAEGRLHDDIQHQIGNLCFLTESANKGLQDKPYESEIKQEALRNSPFWVTKALSRAKLHGREGKAVSHFTTRSEMTEFDVEERGSEIVAFLKSRLAA